MCVLTFAPLRGQRRVDGGQRSVVGLDGRERDFRESRKRLDDLKQEEEELLHQQKKKLSSNAQDAEEHLLTRLRFSGLGSDAEDLESE